MRNDGQKPQGGVPRSGRSNGFLPSSFRTITGYLKIVSSGASTVASAIQSAGASVASSIVDRGADDGHDQVRWAGFDKLQSEGDAIRQVLLLGYRSGFQVWDVEEADNVHELASTQDGPVSLLQMQPKPIASKRLEDKFAEVRPLLVVAADGSCSGSGNVKDGSTPHCNLANCHDTENANLQKRRGVRLGAWSLMAATARALLLSRFNDHRLKPPQSSPLSTRHLVLRPFFPSIIANKRRFSSPAILSCLVSGVDGGGVADDFVSTRKSGLDRGFSVIANMLKRIEPLDTSVISKGVSPAARDSMKQTISTMLGLLPSDQFSISIRVLRRPLDSLLVSSIITGYTLWNAEYRVSLIRNFDLSPESTQESDSNRRHEDWKVKCEETESDDGEVCVDSSDEKFSDERISQSIGDLSPEALNYIQELKSELASMEKELNNQKQEIMHVEYNRDGNNGLLDYLRSLEPDMVNELSRPSSPEVEEIIHHLVRNILKRLFKDDNPSGFLRDSVLRKTENNQDGDNELCNLMRTSRDYLAKLLFWCMLLGHHLRGLENRLHLSCVVGLL